MRTTSRVSFEPVAGLALVALFVIGFSLVSLPGEDSLAQKFGAFFAGRADPLELFTSVLFLAMAGLFFYCAITSPAGQETAQGTERAEETVATREETVATSRDRHPARPHSHHPAPARQRADDHRHGDHARQREGHVRRA